MSTSHAISQPPGARVPSQSLLLEVKTVSQKPHKNTGSQSQQSTIPPNRPPAFPPFHARVSPPTVCTPVQRTRDDNDDNHPSLISNQKSKFCQVYRARGRDILLTHGICWRFNKTPPSPPGGTQAAERHLYRRQAKQGPITNPHPSS